MKTPRIRLSVEVRKYVLQRDNYQCQSCGKKASETQLNIDHIIPLAQGGKNDISNLQTLCQNCNLTKSDKTDNRFRRRYNL
jgi:5-methylcytosine-specific restriction enzyme A